MDVLHYLIVSVAVLIGETFGTIFGGGSFLIQPALLSAGVSPHMAVANDVTAAVFSGLFFVLHGFRRQKPDKQIVVWMLPGIILGAVFGAVLLSSIPDSIERWIILAICCVGLAYNLIHIKAHRARIKGHKRLFPYWRPVTLFVGLGLGIYDGASGAGSGVLFITVLTFLFHLDLKTAALATGAIETFGLGTAALTYWHLGLLDVNLLMIMIPACCVAGVLGSKILHAVSEKNLRIAFACGIAVLISYIVLSS